MSQNQNPKTCSYCGKVSTVPLNVCKGCNKARYCNADCQSISYYLLFVIFHVENDWKKGHKTQCKELAQLKQAIEALQSTHEEKLANAAKRILKPEETSETQKSLVDDEPVDETGVDPQQIVQYIIL